MNQTNLGSRMACDESGMTLVELLVAMAILVVVLTLGFIVTTGLVTVSNQTQANGSLLGPAQNGMQELRDLFANAVLPATVSTPGGTLYTSDCSTGSGGIFSTASASAVSFCALRNGSTAYTYDVSYVSCSSNGVGTLQVLQEPAGSVAFVVDNVLCPPSAPTPFSFWSGGTELSNPPNLSKIQSVAITLTIADVPSGSPPSNAPPTATTRLTSQVLLTNAQGGLL